MQNPSIQAAHDRLNRLETYLQSDPDNVTLLTDAFETALACSEFDRAEFHLRHGLAISQADWSWRLKEGDFWLAKRDLQRAATALQTLQTDPDAPKDLLPVLTHNLAYIELQSGNYAGCVSRLQPFVEVGQTLAEPENKLLVGALQVLWVRALHRLGERQRALAWAQAADAAGRLGVAAAGVVSLIAFDEELLEQAHAWSMRALTEASGNDRPMEALSVQASLALGRRDANVARQLSQQVLALQPIDGRAWSVLGFAEILDGRLEVARDTFRQALAHMPEHIGTWHGLAWTEIGLGNLDGARQAFEQAMDVDRNFAETHGGLAVVQALSGRRDEAQLLSETALRLDRACASAQYAQALLSGNVQEVERLKAMVDRVSSYYSIFIR